jgi:20S proteasome subunit alpha 6
MIHNIFSKLLQNVSIGVVGKGMDFTIYDDGGVEPFLAGLEGEERRGGRPLPPEVEEELKVVSL